MKVYRKPTNYGLNLSQFVKLLLPYSVVINLLFTCWLSSDPQTLQSDTVSTTASVGSVWRFDVRLVSIPPLQLLMHAHSLPSLCRSTLEGAITNTYRLLLSVVVSVIGDTYSDRVYRAVIAPPLLLLLAVVSRDFSFDALVPSTPLLQLRIL
jgi:hypothetical protein